MTEEVFRAKRRQPFLTKKYYNLNSSLLERELELDARATAEGVLPPTDVSYSDIPGSAFKGAMKLLRLHYTAGEPIESLKPLLAAAMKWFGEWHVAYGAQIQHLAKASGEELRTDGSPVHMEDLFHCQLAMELVSFGILLGEADAVRRVAAWLGRYRGTDMLLEALLEQVVADPRDVEEFFHEEPYGLLLDAVYTAENPEAASDFVKHYVEGWYKAFEGVPWHDGHLVVTDEYSNYEGYWAFEAAAICVLYDIDDSSFRDHLVYPKDLADWARANNVVDRLAPAAGAQALRLRCEGGQPCPQAGFWSTPAQANSRRRFAANELMPAVEGSSWGATIWYWDDAQG
ncbi:PoNe immunity protein domain-containing protein [Roseateles sp. BYS87W]|uniref:PoNe immunity protein domain-containing protein n=1 Tax=Pelomonas baiyunensis TaxID=3299026 RepID=A0ABW7H527_9BURK